MAMRHFSQPGVERCYRDGVLMIWPTHLAVLQGLFDRPGGMASTRKATAAAARPYMYGDGWSHMDGSFWAAYRAIERVVERGWVNRQRVGRGMQHWLTPRGRAVLSGELPTRLYGRELYLPGRSRHRRPRRGTIVSLGSGIDVTVPPTWTTGDSEVAEAIAERHSSVFSARPLPADGRLISLVPVHAGEAARLEIRLLPSSTRQESVTGLDEDTLSAYDAAVLRPSAERDIEGEGCRLAYWRGTTREVVGGRYALSSIFAVARSDGSAVRREIHAIHLGSWQVVVDLVVPPGPGSQVEAEVRRMLASLRIAPVLL